MIFAHEMTVFQIIHLYVVLKKIISSNIFSVIILITEKLWNFEKRIYCRHIQVIQVAIRKGNSHERYSIHVWFPYQPSQSFYIVMTIRDGRLGGGGGGLMGGFCFIQTGFNTCWTKLNYILFTLTQIIYFRFIYKRSKG